MFITVRLRDGTTIVGQDDQAKDKFESLVENDLTPEEALNTMLAALTEQSVALSGGISSIEHFSLIPFDLEYGDVVHFNMNDVSYISIHGVENFVDDMHELAEEHEVDLG